MLISYPLYQTLILIWIGVGVFTYFYLRYFKVAPFGRHTVSGWGPMINNKLGWFIMEIVALIGMNTFLFLGTLKINLVAAIIAGLFSMHYINRSIVFPLRIRTGAKQMPVVIMFSAVFFNVVNGFQIGYFLGNYAQYDIQWLYSWQFIIGTILFLGGFMINYWSDDILIHLRKPGELDYKIPTGGLFRWVSCPNHFGEIIEWMGFAILTWSLPGISFLIWTAANLVPRAMAHHQWYKDKFSNYPKDRKAVFPKLL